MFLDEKLLEIGRSWDMTEDSAVYCVRRMLHVCIDSIEENVKASPDEQTVQANFRRVNKTWERVVKQLNEEGLEFASVDGFKKFVQNNSQLTEIKF